MFLTEPGKAEERFDRILNSINAISSSLDGLLCTKNLTPFTDDVIAEYRRQLNAYDHQKHFLNKCKPDVSVCCYPAFTFLVMNPPDEEICVRDAIQIKLFLYCLNYH